MAAGADIIAWAAGIMIPSVRVAMLFIATPFFAQIPMPFIARAVLVFGLSAGVVGPSGLLPISATDTVGMAVLAGKEALIGLILAGGLFAGFGAFHFGGRLLDFQIGFGLSGLIDTATRTSAPLIGTLLSSAAAIVFFSVDGHLELLRLVRESIVHIPPGSPLGRIEWRALAEQFAICFVFGLTIVAPVVAALFIVETGVAFMSRTMPQMNVFVLSLTAKAIVGLVALAGSVPFTGYVMRQLFERIATRTDGLLN
jgi:flagellar biosynthesis protein FliR